MESASCSATLTELSAAYGLQFDYVGSDVGGFSSQNNRLVLKDGSSLLLKRCERHLWSRRAADIAQALAPYSAMVHAPRLTVSGDTFCEVGDQVYSLFPFVDGDKLHGPSFDHETLQSAARALYEFHRIVHHALQYAGINADFNFDAEASRLLELAAKSPRDIRSAVETSIAAKRQILRHVGSLESPQEHPKRELIHGDFHNENIIFHGKNVVAVIDFELVRYGCREDDLISFIMLACCNDGFSEKNVAKARIFISEYQSLTNYQIDLGKGFVRYVYRKSQSLFLEKMLIRSEQPIYVQILHRDQLAFPQIIENRLALAVQLTKGPK